MLSVSANHRVLLAESPVDFRCGIDGLEAICRLQLEENPFSGTLFIFHNRRGTQIRILCYDGQGFWLITKRLSQGRWKWPCSSLQETRQLSLQQLQNLIWNNEWSHLSEKKFWKPLSHQQNP